MFLKAILLTLILFSSNSFADKLPYNSSFPKAEYPYAQAPDGCSSWDSDHPEWVPDTWGLFGNFTEACHAHDRCYYTLGSNVRTCNEDFHNNLFAACKHLSVEKRDSCRLIARQYEKVVVDAEGEVFTAAQEKQKRYLEYANAVINDQYVWLSGSNLSETWKEYYIEFLKVTDLVGIRNDMLVRFAKEIIVNLYRSKTSYLPSDEQITRYTPLLAKSGYEVLWEGIVIIDGSLIVNDRIRMLTGGDRPDDDVKHSILTNFFGFKEIAQVDNLIRSFYLNSQDSVSSMPTTANCDINTMSSWEYYTCISH